MGRFIQTPLAPKPGPYNQGFLVSPNQRLLFLAGQTGNIPGIKGEPVIEGGVSEQTTRALENLVAVVKEASGNAQSFVALDVFLKDPGTPEGRTASRKSFNAAYEKFFQAHGVPRNALPTRAMVWVAEVPLETEDTLVEIKGVAAIY